MITHTPSQPPPPPHCRLHPMTIASANPWPLPAPPSRRRRRRYQLRLRALCSALSLPHITSGSQLPPLLPIIFLAPSYLPLIPRRRHVQFGSLMCFDLFAQADMTWERRQRGM